MSIDIQQIKHRFGIIGSSPLLEHALRTAVQVASTDMSVLVIGESGVGKENFPKIIHQSSTRKHGPYVPVNCGAIPEGTIDSELFGHLKGSFTGAITDRKGYFQEANGGTIFLDEVGELPLATQARLLRVLETGEFIPVGASQAQKTDVRIVAATNVNLQEAVAKGRFREDLLFRLNTVPIEIPPLRARPEDIPLLFRFFASKSADQYHMPALRLDAEATSLLQGYRWPGNIRELRNLTDRMSVLEEERHLTADIVRRYLPKALSEDYHPALRQEVERSEQQSFANERELLYQVLFDMRQDMAELRKLVTGIMQGDIPVGHTHHTASAADFAELRGGSYGGTALRGATGEGGVSLISHPAKGYSGRDEELVVLPHDYPEAHVQEVIEEPLSLEENERRMIAEALIRHKGRRRLAAQELKISERTLYRKIKQYELDEQH